MHLKMFYLLVVIMPFFNQNFADNIQIVTIDSHLQHILKAKTEQLQVDELLPIGCRRSHEETCRQSNERHSDLQKEGQLHCRICTSRYS